MDLKGLINLSLSVNLSKDNANLDLFVCKNECYNKLLKLDRALNKVDEIKKDMRKQFGLNEQRDCRFKRLRVPDESDLENSHTVPSTTPGTGKVVKSLRFPTLLNNSPTDPEIEPTVELRTIEDSVTSSLPTFPVSTAKNGTVNASTEVEITIRYPSKTV